jgi:hypothetical protein
MSDEQLFLSSIYRGDINEIYRLLKKSALAPQKPRDSRGYNALHIAALNSSYSVVDFLIQYVRSS